MERNFAQALGLSRPATLRGWPIRARSGILHASWNGQVPIPAQIGIGLLVASVHLSLLPSALVSVSPRSARPAALGCTSADTVPAPRQNDRIHSARVPAHTWRSARPTVERPLDRPRAPAASPGSGIHCACPPALSGREHRCLRCRPRVTCSRRCIRTLSRTSISSPEASRANVASRETSLWSALVSVASMESRACCSLALRLINGHLRLAIGDRIVAGPPHPCRPPP